MKAILLVAVVMLFAVVGVSRWRGRVSYERRLTTLQAAGEPICAADLARLYPDPPPEKDFRRLLRTALPPGSPPVTDPPVSGTDYGAVRGLSHEQPVPARVLSAIRAEYATNQPVLELLLQTDLNGFAFTHHWATHGFTNNHDLHGDRIFLRIEICRALVCLAASEAEAGHPERANLALVRGLQVARLPSTIGLISFVGQSACESITLSGINRALARGEFAEPELAALAAALPRTRDGLRESLQVERAWNVWLRDPATLRQRGAGGLLPYVTDSRLHSLPLAPQAQLQMQCLLRGYRGRLEMLDRWEERISALDLPVAAQLRAIGLSQSNVWQQVGNRGNATTRVRAFWDLDFRLMELLEPKFLASFQENALIQAGLANAQTVVALERWRRAHPGQWPDGLADLVPAYLKVVPLDPFTGEPVRFRRLPQGYVVYCVGMDLTDDGGKEGGRGENPGTDSTLRVLQ